MNKKKEKKRWDDTKSKHDSPSTATTTTPKKAKKVLNEDSLLFKAFTSYRLELDTRNDKYEQIVKLSRDITINSKRLIFCLLRRGDNLNTIIAEGEEKLAFILDLIDKVGEAVLNEDRHQFARAYSPGLQEFIEAITLLHFRKDNNLVSYEKVKNLYFSKYDILSQYDYMLGVADLTGELMRMAINSIGEGEFDQVEKICCMLQKMYKTFSVFMGCHREMNRKINVMKNSVRKVENACYTLRVRGSEIPKHMLLELVHTTEDTAEG